MKNLRILVLLVSLLVTMSLNAQSTKNFIKPLVKDGFYVDSILSLKGNTIIYMRAGTEFDIEKAKVAYVEHSILGRIDITDGKTANQNSTILLFPEPEFNGDAFICNLEDKTYIKMERAIGQVKIKDQLWGPESKLYVKPEASPVRIPKGKVVILIRVPDVNEDPKSFVKVSRFSVSKTRKLSLARQNELTGKITYGGYNRQEKDFTYKRYGKSSLLLTVDIDDTGEYCVSISNPNRVDSKLSVSCFGVDE